MKDSRTTIAVPTATSRFLRPLIAEARKSGLGLYMVGGPVRDWILKRPTFDLDLAVVGDPEPLARLCADLIDGSFETFGRFGTWRMIGRSHFRVDFATTRTEKYPSPSALPELTATGVTIEQDLFRRDFTINAMAVRLDDDSCALVDPYGGLRDLKARVIRVLHPESFHDDPTRIFRAARFLGRLHAKPAARMKEQAHDVLRSGEAAKLSRHRLLHELLCLLAEKSPKSAFSILEEWGHLGLLHPELPWRMAFPGGIEPRLAAIALGLGPIKGREFVDSFPFEHRLRTQLVDTLGLASSDRSPRAAASEAVVAAVRRAFPALAPAALKPCFVSGSDLIKLGRKPGPEFHAILDEAARLQRLGKLRTRIAALSWLLHQ